MDIDGTDLTYGYRVNTVGHGRRIMSLYCFGDMILGRPSAPAPPASR